MIRFLLLFTAIFTTIHAAGPVRVAVDSQVVNWAYRCSTNNFASFGGERTFTLIAQSRLMKDLRDQGFYPGLVLRLNSFCGVSYGGTNGCGNDIANDAVGQNIGSPQIPLINDQGGSIDLVGEPQGYWKYIETGTSGGFGATSSLGLGPLGTYAYLKTGFNLSNVNATISLTNDIGISMYLMGTTGSESAAYAGANDGTNQITHVAVFTANGQGSAIWASAGQPVTADTNGAGLYTGTRTGSGATGVQQYKNQLSKGASSSVGGSPKTMNLDIYIFAQNGLATVNLQSTNLSGGYAITKGLTATQVTNGWYNAWQAFETFLGRQK